MSDTNQICFMEVDGKIVFFNEAEAVSDLDANEPEELEMIDTINGVTSSAIIYSIAETAKANNLKPYEYFEYLLTQIPAHADVTIQNDTKVK